MPPQFINIGVGDDWEAPLTSTFVVDVDGKTIGHFTEVQGLQLEIEVEEIQEGGVNGFVHKVPGRMKWPNLILKRGVTDSDTLFAWMQESSGDGFTSNSNKVTRSTMGITLRSADGTALREWSVEGAMPIKWSGPTFAASSDDVLNEELEIAHHGFKSESF